MGVRALLLVGLVAAQSCAPIQSEPEAPPDPTVSVATAEKVFEAGYGSIVDRYIELLSAETVASEGLRRLVRLDPSLKVGRDGDAIVLTAGGEPRASFVAPPVNDVAGWAKLTARFWLATRRVSTPLASASAERVYEAVFDGATSMLDVFSRYSTAEEARLGRFRRHGHDGIGVGVRLEDGVPRITEVASDSPAASAGLRVGDWVTHIDGVSVAGLSEREVVERLAGAPGSQIALTLRRDDAAPPFYLLVERARVIPATVKAWSDNSILYLAISGFNRSTAEVVSSHLADHAKGTKGAVIDLRGNPGGLLNQSVKVADLFLDRGHIVATRGRHPDSGQRYKASGRDLLAGRPIVVVVDGGSASAAEILAAVLQDRGRAVVIGASSYGKGTVQTIVSLPNQGEITLTWSRVFPPSGIGLQGHGVVPAVCTGGLLRRDHDEVEQIVATRLRGLQRRSQDDRESCPAERRSDDLDLRIARRLIEDRFLYARALRQSPVIAAVVN